MPNQVLENFRAKYPKYQAVDDSTLAAGILSKYPQYKDALADVGQHRLPFLGSDLGSPSPEAAVQTQKELSQIWTQPGATALKGVSQLTSNPLAGLLNIGSGLAQTAAAPFSTVAAVAKQVPILSPLVSGAETGLGAVGDFVGGHFRAGTQTLAAPFLGEQGAKDVAQPVGDLASMGSQALATYGAGRAVGELPVRNPIPKANVGFNRAFPTQMKELTRPQDLARMAPYLKDEQLALPVNLGDIQKGGENPSVARQLAKEKFPNIKQKIYGEQTQVIGNHASVPLAGGVDKIASSVESLRNIFTENIDVLKDQSVLAEAAKYRKMGSINLDQARQMLQSINANLSEFYKKTPEAQAAAENMAKPIAEMEKAAESIRDQIVQTLNESGADGAKYRELSLDYGAAAKLEAAAERNITRAESPLPPFFTERTSTVYPSKPGVLREVGEHTIGRLNTPDRLANRAMKRYAKAGEIRNSINTPPFFVQPKNENK